MTYLLAHPDPNPRIMYYYYYWKQLYAADRADLDTHILEVMRRRWKAMADFPWQTSFEDFYVGSKAHCYGMFPGYFLSAYVLGVRRIRPVTERHLLIEPRLGDLKSAEGTVVTEFGPVPVSWTVAGAHLDFQVVIPAGVTATVNIPHIGAKPHLTLYGKRISAPTRGRCFTLTLGPGTHAGRVTFTPLPPPVPTPIETRVSDSSQSAFEADLRTDSLIGSGQPTYLSTANERCSNGGGGSSADALRNGTTRNGSGGPDTQNDGKTYRGYGTGDTVTFRLNTSAHPAGYDLTRIATYAGHGDSRASQHYAISVAFVSDPAKFAVLVPDAAVECEGGSSEIVCHNPHGGVIAFHGSVKAEGVSSVRFDFRDGHLGFNVYREIQIFGHRKTGTASS